MHPHFFQLGPVEIRWYGVMVALGFLVGIWTTARRARRVGLKSEVIVDLGFVAMVAGIIGARLFYVVMNWNEFVGRPLEIIRIDHGGLVFYGGFIGAAAAMLAYGYYKKLPIGAYADVLAAGLPLGHALGRIGCFLNGCCFGKSCGLPWAVTFPKTVDGGRYSDVFYQQLNAGQVPPFAPSPLPVHPSQLYEALGLLLLAALMTWWFRRRAFQNWLMWVYVGLYGVLRFVVEFFRADEPRWLMERFTTAQGLAVAMVIVSAVVIFGGRRFASTPVKNGKVLASRRSSK